MINNKPDPEGFRENFEIYLGVSKTEENLVKDELFTLLKDNYDRWWD